MADLDFGPFVECPGVAEIRWKSDDPEYCRAPEDIYEKQTVGIATDMGKKNKRTTEQASFFCIICESDLSSLKTFKAHCGGLPHLRAQSKKLGILRREGKLPPKPKKPKNELRDGLLSPAFKHEYEDSRINIELPPELLPSIAPSVDASIVDADDTANVKAEQKLNVYADEKPEVKPEVKVEVSTAPVNTLDFNREVANVVMARLNRYYYPEEVPSCPVKIDTEAEYTALAKTLSKRFRHQEKNSYALKGNDANKITMTGPMKSRIERAIDLEMEARPIVD